MCGAELTILALNNVWIENTSFSGLCHLLKVHKSVNNVYDLATLPMTNMCSNKIMNGGGCFLQHTSISSKVKVLQLVEAQVSPSHERANTCHSHAKHLCMRGTVQFHLRLLEDNYMVRFYVSSKVIHNNFLQKT